MNLKDAIDNADDIEKTLEQNRRKATKYGAMLNDETDTEEAPEDSA